MLEEARAVVEVALSMIGQCCVCRHKLTSTYFQGTRDTHRLLVTGIKDCSASTPVIKHVGWVFGDKGLQRSTTE